MNVAANAEGAGKNLKRTGTRKDSFEGSNKNNNRRKKRGETNTKILKCDIVRNLKELKK